MTSSMPADTRRRSPKLLATCISAAPHDRGGLLPGFALVGSDPLTCFACPGVAFLSGRQAELFDGASGAVTTAPARDHRTRAILNLNGRPIMSLRINDEA